MLVKCVVGVRSIFHTFFLCVAQLVFLGLAPRRTATVRAKIYCEVASLRFDAIRHLLRQHPELSKRLDSYSKLRGRMFDALVETDDDALRDKKISAMKQELEYEFSVSNSGEDNPHKMDRIGNVDRVMPADARGWSVRHVAEWLGVHHLSQYCDKFEENCIDGPMLLDLTEDEFKELGVENSFHRRRFLLLKTEQAERLKEEASGLSDSMQEISYTHDIDLLELNESQTPVSGQDSSASWG